MLLDAALGVNSKHPSKLQLKPLRNGIKVHRVNARDRLARTCLPEGRDGFHGRQAAAVKVELLINGAGIDRAVGDQQHRPPGDRAEQVAGQLVGGLLVEVLAAVAHREDGVAGSVAAERPRPLAERVTKGWPRQ
jgi:hypothetical protein